MKPRVTTKQKQVVDTEKIKRRKSMYSTTKNHQFKRKTARLEERKKPTRQPENSQ